MSQTVMMMMMMMMMDDDDDDINYNGDDNAASEYLVEALQVSDGRRDGAVVGKLVL